jgi:hypothetical protein
MAYPCPRCTDRYTQSLPMVFQSGIRQWSNYRSSGTSQSNLSRLVAPPRQQRTAFRWIALAFLLLVSVLSIRSITSGMFPGWFAAEEVHHQAPVIDGPAYLRQKMLRQRMRHDIPKPPAPSAQAHTPSSAPIPTENLIIGTALFFVLESTGVVVIIRSLRRAQKYNREVWPQRMAYWQASFLCRGCGLIFRP